MTKTGLARRRSRSRHRSNAGGDRDLAARVATQQDIATRRSGDSLVGARGYKPLPLRPSGGRYFLVPRPLEDALPRPREAVCSQSFPCVAFRVTQDHLLEG